MTIELLEMSTEEFLKFVNKVPEFGDITVLDLAEATDTFSDLQPDDVVIYYDYITDDIRNTAEEETVVRSIATSLLSISQFMEDKGYSQVEELDGSGGGLWYGSIVYRKV